MCCSRLPYCISLSAEPLFTTAPVLTEAFYLLGPRRIGSPRLMDFITGHGLTVWFLDDRTLTRAFELMMRYADQPMDLAEASLVVLAEALKLHTVFTIDRSNFFSVYRIRRGHRYLCFGVLSC